LASEPPPLLIATRSADKVREIRDILAGSFSGELVSLDDVAFSHHPDEEHIEAFDTFIANARAKARWFAAKTGFATLADDSGICVDALNGAPGVRSRRFAWRPGLQGLELDRANNAELLSRLRGTSPEQRTAHYVCAAAFAQPHSTSEIIALGTVTGTLLEKERGQGGFGYDPLFLLPSAGRTFAEIDHEKKDVSHRGRAFRALAVALRP
jgi:XTP/dITP diphosphohydrolase